MFELMYEVWRAPKGDTHAIALDWGGRRSRLCAFSWGPVKGWEREGRLTPVTCRRCKRNWRYGSFETETRSAEAARAALAAAGERGGGGR